MTFPETAEQENVETIQITTFEDAQPVAVEAPHKFIDHNIFPEDNQSIIQFLERPVLVHSDVFNSVKPVETFVQVSENIPIVNLSFPSTLFDEGEKSRKLDNFAYFKANIKIKLTINANNMTNGSFYMTYVPLHNFQPINQAIFRKSRESITSYPGVIIDIQDQNSIEIEIPYLYWAEAYPLYQSTLNNNFVTDYVSLMVFPLTPIRSQGNYDVTFQIWASFSDITLVGPTPHVYNSFDRSYGLMQYSQERAEMQIAGEQTPSVSSPNISNSLFSTKNLISTLPLPGWISRAMNSAASIFGFSTPIENNPPQKIVNIPAYGFTNVSHQDSSTVLGAHSDNEVTINHGTYDDIDELSIPLLGATPALTDVFEFNTGDRVYNVLGTILNSVLPKSDSSSSPTVYAPTVFEYAASLFSFWRGDLVLRLKVVKTAFHSGRLEVIYVPDLSTNDLLPVNFDASNCYRQIWDITNQSEFVFKVPYFCTNLVTSTSATTDIPGKVIIRCITPLLCPETVANTVDILVFKHYDNFQLFCPASVPYKPYVPSAPAYATFRNGTSNTIYYRLAGETTVNLFYPSDVLYLSKSVNFSSTDGVDAPAASPLDFGVTPGDDTRIYYQQNATGGIVGGTSSTRRAFSTGDRITFTRIDVPPVTSNRVIRNRTNHSTPRVIYYKTDDGLTGSIAANQQYSMQDSSSTIYLSTDEITIDVPTTVKTQFFLYNNLTNQYWEVYLNSVVLERWDCPRGDPTLNFEAPGTFSFDFVRIVDFNREEANVQISVDNKASDTTVNSVFQNSNPSSLQTYISQTVAGEIVVSLRSLLKRSARAKQVDVNNTKKYIVLPEFNNEDNLSFISKLFCYFSGGFNYKFFSPSNTVAKFVTNLSLFDKINIRNPSHITYTQINPVHEVSIPYYNRYRMNPILVPESSNSTVVGKPKIPVLYYYSDSSDGFSSQLYISAKDDFNFHTLIGPPYLVDADEVIL